MAAVDYGSDLSTYQNLQSGVADLDPTFAVIRGPRVVVERIARKLITPTGMMLKAGWGYDLRSFLQASPTTAEIGQLRGIVQDQIEQEPEVASVDVTIAYTLELRTLTITARVTLKTDVVFALVFTLVPGNVTFVISDMTQEAA